MNLTCQTPLCITVLLISSGSNVNVRTEILFRVETPAATITGVEHGPAHRHVLWRLLILKPAKVGNVFQSDSLWCTVTDIARCINHRAASKNQYLSFLAPLPPYLERSTVYRIVER